MNLSTNALSLMPFVYLFGVLRRFQHCTGHITTGSWKGRGNQYIQFIRVLYCKLPTNGKQLPAFTLEAVPGTSCLLKNYNSDMRTSRSDMNSTNTSLTYTQSSVLTRKFIFVAYM